MWFIVGALTMLLVILIIVVLIVGEQAMQTSKAMLEAVKDYLRIEYGVSPQDAAVIAQQIKEKAIKEISRK